MCNFLPEKFMKIFYSELNRPQTQTIYFYRFTHNGTNYFNNYLENLYSRKHRYFIITSLKLELNDKSTLRSTITFKVTKVHVF